MCKEYPGELGKRRKRDEDSNPREVMDPRVGLRLITGKPGDTRPEIEAEIELLGNRAYYDMGIPLLAEHYGIAAPVPKSVIDTFSLPRDGAFWRELSLKLLKDNVPYFMPGPPPHPGRPRTREPDFAGLDLAVQVIKEKKRDSLGENAEMLKIYGFKPDQLPSTVNQAQKIFADKCGITVSTVIREFRKWKRPRPGGNSTK